ncbi:MAG: hypothetical protein ABIP36_00080 [Acidimicrobiales bacterium]
MASSGPPTRAHERCSQCGFDGSRYDDPELLDAIRALIPQWQELLTSAGPELRDRPQPEVWSAFEYAAHSRDITALHVFGVMAALQEDEPVVGDIGDDVIQSAADAYGGEHLLDVQGGLTAELAGLADRAAAAAPGAWSRGLIITGTRMDVRALLEHALHDSTHHVADVERGLSQLRR